jgi:3-hydroxymyristoyl/3-hydroxydecanoyl-(acyl carrier protein) dehydratase
MKPPCLHSMEISNDEGVFYLDVQPDMEVFRGHFPGHPILAGVVQLDWAMHFAVTYLGCTQRIGQKFKIKFHHIIRPNMPLALVLRLDHVKGCLFFTYRSEKHIMSHGQITLKD